MLQLQWIWLTRSLESRHPCCYLVVFRHQEIRPSLVQIIAWRQTHLNQCWHSINWTFWNKFQWNSKQNKTIINQENEFENAVCKMAAIFKIAAILQTTCSNSFSWMKICFGLNVLTHWPLGDPYVIFKSVIFNLALLIAIFKSSYDDVLRWMPQDLTDDKSTLVQVMAWCRQATSHYLNQCWPRSPTPNGVTRPQWVNITKQNTAKPSAYFIGHICTYLLAPSHYIIDGSVHKGHTASSSTMKSLVFHKNTSALLLLYFYNT